MDSGMQQQQQQQMMGSGLTRYRSAPSSYFASILGTTPPTASTGGGGGGFSVGDDLEHLINTRVSSRHHHHHHGFPRLVTPQQHTTSNNNNNNNNNMSSHFGASSEVKPEVDIIQQQQQQQQRTRRRRRSSSDYAAAAATASTTFSVSKMSQHQSQSSQADHLRHNYRRPPNHLQATLEDSSPAYNRYASSVPVQMKTGGLIRHSSSPAGLFDQFNIKYEYGAMRSGGGGGGGGLVGNTNNAAEAAASVALSNWFSKDSGLGEMTPISEMEAKSTGDEGGGSDAIRNHEDDLITSFLDSDTSWEDSAILSDEFLKGFGDSDRKLFSSVNASAENNEGQNRPVTTLTHHLSLPTSSAELASVEKMSEDTVLCKIRAKRGCATHPRSIAERVRRTRISERMRKLQELVPNMDKQTNTADMLDLAVDYIKDLEKELKMWSGRVEERVGVTTG